MRPLPDLSELMEVLPILKGWYTGGTLKPTLEEATAAYVGGGWLIAQGYDLLGGGATALSVDACEQLNAFEVEANAPTATRIGDGELIKKWGPILAPIFLGLLRKWVGV